MVRHRQAFAAGLFEGLWSKFRSLQVLGVLIGAPQGACLGALLGAALVPAATVFGSETLGKALCKTLKELP